MPPPSLAVADRASIHRREDGVQLAGD